MIAALIWRVGSKISCQQIIGSVGVTKPVGLGSVCRTNK